MRRTSLLAAAVAAVLVSGTAQVAVAQAPAAAPPPPITWGACEAQPDFECATTTAPLDYDEPDGPQIDVAIIRHTATDPSRRAGSLFFNPGGPGGASTAGLPIFYNFFSKEIQARYDIVGIDPRGIGGSTQLRCYDTPAQEAEYEAMLPAGGFPSTPEEERAAIDANRGFAEACAAHGGPIQHHMGTADVARDMDRVRVSLGEDKLDYYGPSYGSYLGITYANLFPDEVGRIILDGNVAPEEWNDRKAGTSRDTFSRIQSPLGTELALQTLMFECGKVSTDRCAFSAGSSKKTYQKYRQLLDRLEVEPVEVGGQSFTRAVTISTVAQGMPFEQPTQVGEAMAPGWVGLAATLQSLWEASEPGAPAPAPAPAPTPVPVPTTFGLQLPEGTSGVLCGESPNPTDPAAYQRSGLRSNATQSPSGFGPLQAWQAAPCASWKARDADTYTGPWTRSSAPILLIGTLGDPNTSYTGTLKMASQIRNGRVLTETGGGHTALVNKSRCVDSRIEAYLATGALPPRGTVCAQDKPPF